MTADEQITVRRLMRAGTVLLGVALMANDACSAGFVKPGEMRRRDDWVRAHLPDIERTPARPATRATTGPVQPAPPAAGLDVLANHDPVHRNARGGKPLRLGKTEYRRGLYCHAVSRIRVRLPGPGRTFSAVIGVDSNADTAGGKGSVVFSVTVAGKVAFKSEVTRESTPTRPVSVDLAGAEEFYLDISDAGDGIACDQSDWADAKVTLADGRELWLGDMPLRDMTAPPPLKRTGDLPFAFIYGGQSSDDLLAAWPMKAERTDLGGRTRRTFTWTDPRGGLEVRCMAVEYADFPAVEWTVYLRNAGKADTPVLEGIQGLDVSFEAAGEPDREFIIRTCKGDTCRADLYEPLELRLGPGAVQRFAPQGGRGTNHAWPYYNVQMPGGGPPAGGGLCGVFVAVGWPGQWAATFARDAGGPLRITAGQQLTRMVLRPGEEVRGPLIALLFWEEGQGGSGTEAQRPQNLWRRWMIAHNVPRTADGKLPPPILHGNTSGEFNEMINANEENQKLFIDRYAEERIRIDFWWMDAGWYPCEGNWPKTGTWEPDLKRFPNGLRAISDHARKKGVRTLVWFEPERVAGGTWLAQNHPQWLLGPLLNLGSPEARQWLTDHVDRVLREQGIDLYRQDFNMDPLGCWRGNDPPDRQGITENLHVQGYLAYWDELRRRHPGLIIDSCASGGRRNDLETMRRAVPLHPTDYNYGHLAAKQAFHQTLSQWIPYFGSNTVPVDTADAYAFRSGHAMSVVLGYDLRRKDLDCALLRRLTEEWRRTVDRCWGDYYTLTPYSLGEENWIAWQFHRPDQGDGVVQAFRRAKCDQAAQTLRLSGLDPAAQYEVTNLDGGAPRTIAGKELMDQGLTVEIKAKPGAAVIAYSRRPPPA